MHLPVNSPPPLLLLLGHLPLLCSTYGFFYQPAPVAIIQSPSVVQWSPTLQFTVNGSDSYDVGTDVPVQQFVWSVARSGDGLVPTLTPDNATSLPQFTVMHPEPGEYAIALQVVDVDGGLGTASWNVLVNVPPVAHAASAVLSDGTVQLLANSSVDPEDSLTALQFSWTVAVAGGSEPPTDLSLFFPVNTAATPSVVLAGTAPGVFLASRFRRSGQHWFMVTVTDSSGGSATAATAVSTSIAVSAGTDVALAPSQPWVLLNATLASELLSPTSVLSSTWAVVSTGPAPLLTVLSSEVVQTVSSTDHVVARSTVNVSDVAFLPGGGWHTLSWTAMLEGGDQQTAQVRVRSNLAPVVALSPSSLVTLVLPTTTSVFSVAQSTDDEGNIMRATWTVVGSCAPDALPAGAVNEDNLLTFVRTVRWNTPFQLIATWPGAVGA